MRSSGEPIRPGWGAAAAALFVVAAGCDQPFGLQVDLDAECSGAATVVLDAVYLPEQQEVRRTFLVAEAFPGGRGRFLIIPPDGSEEIDLEIWLTDASGATLASTTLKVPVSGAAIVERQVALPGVCHDGGAVDLAAPDQALTDAAVDQGRLADLAARPDQATPADSSLVDLSMLSDLARPDMADAGSYDMKLPSSDGLRPPDSG